MTHHEFIKVPIRPFVQIDVNLTTAPDHTEQILQELQKHTLDEAIVKIIYHIPSGIKDYVDLQKIVQACSSAHYVVSITPVRSLDAREKRATMHHTMDFVTALSTYLDSKKELQSRKDDLIKKALELHNETPEIEQEL